MFWIFVSLFLMPSFSRAEAPPVQIPEAVREKWGEVSTAVVQGYDAAKKKVDQAGREELGVELKRKLQTAQKSSFAQSVVAAAGRLWVLTKSKAHGGLVYLDERFHEKVLGTEGHPPAP